MLHRSTAFGDTTPEMRIVRNFRTGRCIPKFKTEAEIIANNTKYGLAGTVFTDDQSVPSCYS